MMDTTAPFDNAIRRELSDMYSMLHSMIIRGITVTEKDYGEFLLWWSRFADFVTNMLLLEEDILFPWLASKAKFASDDFDSKRRMHYKSSIFSSFDVVRRLSAEQIRKTRSLISTTIKPAVDHIGTQLVEYLAKKENFLAILLMKHTTEEEAEALVESMVRRILADEEGASHFSQICHHMWTLPDGNDVVTAWRRRFVNSIRDIMLRKQATKYTEHVDIVARFIRKGKIYTREETEGIF